MITSLGVVIVDFIAPEQKASFSSNLEILCESENLPPIFKNIYDKDIFPKFAESFRYYKVKDEHTPEIFEDLRLTVIGLYSENFTEVILYGKLKRDIHRENEINNDRSFQIQRKEGAVRLEVELKILNDALKKLIESVEEHLPGLYLKNEFIEEKLIKIGILEVEDIPSSKEECRTWLTENFGNATGDKLLIFDRGPLSLINGSKGRMLVEFSDFNSIEKIVWEPHIKVIVTKDYHYKSKKPDSYLDWIVEELSHFLLILYFPFFYLRKTEKLRAKFAKLDSRCMDSDREQLDELMNNYKEYIKERKEIIKHIHEIRRYVTDLKKGSLEIKFQNEICLESDNGISIFKNASHRIHHLYGLCEDYLLSYCSELEKNSEIGVQYLHDLVEERSIMTNIDLQKSMLDSGKRLENLTRRLVALTIVLVALTSVLAFLTLVLIFR